MNKNLLYREFAMKGFTILFLINLLGQSESTQCTWPSGFHRPLPLSSSKHLWYMRDNAQRMFDELPFNRILLSHEINAVLSHSALILCRVEIIVFILLKKNAKINFLF